jgi:hypothetical protein
LNITSSPFAEIAPSGCVLEERREVVVASIASGVFTVGFRSSS